MDRSEERRLEIVIGNLLRFGVVLSAFVVGVGAILYLIRHGTEIPAYGSFHGERAGLTHPAAILRAAIRLQARPLIQLGLLLLIATPVARVGFSAYAFCRLRDWKYAGISLIVLGLLLYSLFWTH
ncbi:MAG: DUF1634 domain-containing protein [Bryobacteraceae bacterium]